MGVGEPNSELSQQVEEAEAEVTGENHDRTPMQNERPLTLGRKCRGQEQNEKGGCSLSAVVWLVHSATLSAMEPSPQQTETDPVG